MSPAGGFLLGPPFARRVDAPPPDADPLHAFADDALADPLDDDALAKLLQSLEGVLADPLPDGTFAFAEPLEAAFADDIGYEGPDPLVDLFHVATDTPPQRLRHLLHVAWEEDALTALKLICNLRDVRGTGKGDREGFYTAALWMHHNHPRTLTANLRELAHFGCLKDLPELLYRLVHGADARKPPPRNSPTCSPRAGDKRARNDDDADAAPPAKRSTKPTAADPLLPETTTTTNKVHKATELAVLAMAKYKADRAYRTLFDHIAHFFADLLASDLNQLQLGDKRGEIGLAAKWCPTPGTSFDRATLLCEAIARRMFPRDSNPADYAHLPEEHYTYRVLHRLRREVLVPLRKALKLPEVYMSDGRWSELPYNRVAKEATRRYKLAFQDHDEKRFAAFLEAGKAAAAALATNKMVAGGDEHHLLPHQIASMAMANDGRASGLWRSMVEDLRAKGVLRNCIALCDVSEGMHGTPMDVCVALGLLISELSDAPWRGKVLGFSSDSAGLESISGDNLRQRLQFILGMKCDAKTNLREVMLWILRTGMFKDVEPANMIRTIFVFTNRDFDRVSVHDQWRREYEHFRYEAYVQRWGFGEQMPQIVIWNLAGRRTSILTTTQDGVMRLSGFSDELMRLFLEKDGIVIPEYEMEAAIAGDEYQRLDVLD